MINSKARIDLFLTLMEEYYFLTARGCKYVESYSRKGGRRKAWNGQNWKDRNTKSQTWYWTLFFYNNF